MVNSLAILTTNSRGYLDWFLTEVELMYNLVLVSVIHTHLSPFKRLFSHIDHYRVLSRVPCAIQYVVISYVLYSVCILIPNF